jgi:hypothetical protein
MIRPSGMPKDEGTVMRISSLTYGFISWCFLRVTNAEAGHNFFGNEG